MFSGHSLAAGPDRRIAGGPGERRLEREPSKRGLDKMELGPDKMELEPGMKELGLGKMELELHRTALGHRTIAEVLRSWTWAS